MIAAGRRRGAACLAGLVAAVLALPALAQDRDLQALLQRLDRLERDIRTLHLQAARGGAAPSLTAPPAQPAAANEALPRIDVRVTALDEELRSLTGREERLAHQIDQLNRRLDKLVGDVDFRLSAIERAMAARPVAASAAPPPNLAAAPGPASVSVVGPPGTAPGTEPGVLGRISQGDLAALRAGKTPAAVDAGAQAAPAPLAVLPEGTSRERYTYAFGLLRQARYDQAEEALRAFLQIHGDDPLAANARYWLGETYYVRRDFAQAAEVFLEAYQRQPMGGKAPDTLLKLGMALANLDKKGEACAAFDKLGVDFPDAAASIQATMRRQRLRSECP